MEVLGTLHYNPAVQTNPLAQNSLKKLAPQKH